MIQKSLCLAILVSVLVLAAREESYAIPAFARKYNTSCVTCHVGFPKLNAFGEAFRRNGYQFPGHTDPEFIKQEEVSLGAEGNKASFPDAIWPGSIPGSSPISLFLDGEADYNPTTLASDPTTKERFSFGGLGNAIETAIGGTLGEDVSFWGQASFNRDGLELNRVFITLSNLVGDSYSLNMRVGVFEPQLTSFSTHRAWMEGYWFTTRPLNNDMAFTFEEIQNGVELNGIIAGRMFYSAGVLEGFGTAHSDKDIYGHIAYKFGGLPLDGVNKGAATSSLQPYIDNSVTIGTFVYSGSSLIPANPNEMMLVGDSVFSANDQPNLFKVFGGDVNIWYDRFNLFGAVSVRTDNHPFLEAPTLGAKTATSFGELDCVVFPWLLPGVRVESWTSDNAIVNPTDPTKVQTQQFTDLQIVPGIVFLLRPNVKFTVRSSWLKAAGDNKFQPGQTQFLMILGM